MSCIRRTSFPLALAAILAALSLPGFLRAQTVLYWDINGATAGASGGTTAAGTWDQNTTSDWTTTSGGTTATRTWNTGTNKIATFSAGTNATGAFTVTTNGAITSVGGIDFQEGNVTVGGGGTLTLTNSSTINVTPSSATISAILTGTVGFTKNGGGTLTLSGANTYTGATNINAGVLRAQSAGALGTAANSGSTTVADGATLQLANGITTTNGGTLVLNGTGGGAGALQGVNGNNTWNSSISLASDATIFSATAGSTLYLNDNYVSAHTLSLGDHTLTIDGPGNTWANANVGVIGDTGGLIKNGTGALTFFGYNTFYTGTTTVNAGSLELVVGPFSAGWYGINGPLTIGAGSSNPALAGTVNVNIWAAGHAMGSSYPNQISPNSAVTVNSDGALNVGVSTTVGSLTLNGGRVNITSGQTVTASGGITSNANAAHQTSVISGGTLSLPAAATISVARDPTLASDLTISSTIGGTGSVIKTGAGTLTLSGTNTYTGGTNIQQGKLQLGVNNALANGGAITVASGAVFDLNSYSDTVGAISGAGTVRTSGGTLTLGAAMNLTGTLELNGGRLNLAGFNSTLGTLAVTANSILDFGSGIASRLGILGDITIDSLATLSVQNWANTVDYFFAQFGDPGSDIRSRIVFTGFTGADTKWVALDNQITPVPEPAAYGAALLGLSALFAGCRSRRRKA